MTPASTAGGGANAHGGSRRATDDSNQAPQYTPSCVLGQTEARFVTIPHCRTTSADSRLSCGSRTCRRMSVAPSNGRFATTLNGLARKGDVTSVRAADVCAGKARSEAAGEDGIDLDGDHACACPGERDGERAAAGAEVEDEVAGPNPGRANELRCELATAEEVPAAAASCSRSDGHGKSPCPSVN